MATSKKMYNWSFKPISQKEQNASRWPFKVIYSEGKTKQMECRSITSLIDSFENTPYNLNDCDKVLSRYSAILKIFKGKYSSMISKITHMCITFNDVYFLVDDEIKEFNYSSLLNCSVKDIDRLAFGLDVKSECSKNNISSCFNKYKAYKSNETLEELKYRVKLYIDERIQMKVIDNTKLIFDIFKLQDLKFSGLKYLILVPEPSQAINYQYAILQSMNKYKISRMPELEDLLKAIPSLKDEEFEFNKCAKSRPKQYLRAIRKIYCLKDQKKLDKDKVFELFTKVNSPTYIDGLIYQAELNTEEKAMVDKKIKDLERQKGAMSNEFIKKYFEDISKHYKAICVEINKMVNMCNISNKIYEKGKEKNDAETDIWMNEYNPVLMKSRIQVLYDYKSRNLDKSLPVISVLETMNSINEFSGEITKETLDVFKEYIVPNYFKDDRKTFKSIGCGLKTADELKILKNTINEIHLKIIELFEIYLGLHFATFGAFMVRYGISGLSIVNILVEDITNNLTEPFMITENVLEKSNTLFYLISKHKSDFYKDTNNKEFLTNEEIRFSLGDLVDFTKKYLTIMNINGMEPIKLTLEDNSMDVNLFKVSNSVYAILRYACEKYNLNI